MKKLIICMSALALFACKDEKKETTVTTTQNVDTTNLKEQTPVEKATPIAESPTALSTKTVNNDVVTVTKAKVIGKVLYVELIVKNTEDSSLYVMNIQEINYIDDVEAKKHEILKDDEGQYQASPLQSSRGSKLQMSTSESQPEVLISLRFPAPPETSKTITLNMPDFGSFDAINITR
ncbi:hypothetical protein H1R17_07065 [Flavobacterium sp. xlx-214]|uniref:hypothetical protein n=1 Tax=unclassified Flavobacterium TaxID=196869 RepID=UPI0013D3281D|nr:MULTISPECIES: hypothetical protein [unclassified Flavobacterium]MBA5793822.1 hypothetical protein [Flavobacterium sp. xlx-221]QMI84876.1 hypothetical protein H1R17_07065 [Flavobacterium sp. xlx-214]